MAIAYRILRDADLADDAVQAALITAWRELRTLRDPDRFEPWLHRILTHECYAEARRRTRWSVDIRILPDECYAEARRRTRWSVDIRILPVDRGQDSGGILTSSTGPFEGSPSSSERCSSSGTTSTCPRSR
jgi:DNA-directed RNA polymerase specialized sigma24 family protein